MHRYIRDTKKRIQKIEEITDVFKSDSRSFVTERDHFYTNVHPR